MDRRNAFGFLATGVGMLLLPSTEPSWFPAVSGGPDAAVMWLDAMGFVLTVFGSSLVLRHYLFPAIGRWIETGRTAAAERHAVPVAHSRAMHFGLPGR